MYSFQKVGNTQNTTGWNNHKCVDQDKFSQQ